EDPATTKENGRRRATETFEPLATKYLAWRQAQKKPLKPRSYEEVERHLMKHGKPLHGLGVAGITRSTIAAELAKIETDSGPVARNRVRTSWSKFFTWLLKEGHLGEDGTNPVTHTNKADEEDRERVLTNDELREIWAALSDKGDDFGDIVRLLLLTGQRR